MFKPVSVFLQGFALIAAVASIIVGISTAVSASSWVLGLTYAVGGVIASALVYTAGALIEIGVTSTTSWRTSNAS